MNLNVSLTDDLAKYIKDKVASGLYASSSDVVTDALRLLEERDQADAQDTQRLKTAWKEGIESGGFEPLDLNAIKAEGRARKSAKMGNA
ncbi:type II toxin-antitoxin system ParD family antitoxin [Pararhizobium sp.]|uniref:type II toxin-antitoxin system ParD family antitoxin n=1 Tax=Pararhizobium sp. TaxID=1977563 RepID=UPI002724107F|nr:type II toxin-antitoxin system ParD family antitoxin [Pararhizobium sp.]MDO9417203.1 type II toxin-antitoxin system ParD family antitoxin [Pararhizobium sp.]